MHIQCSLFAVLSALKRGALGAGGWGFPCTGPSSKKARQKYLKKKGRKTTVTSHTIF